MSALPQRVALPVMALPVMAPVPVDMRLIRVTADDTVAVEGAVDVRPAVLADVPAMHALQRDYVADRILLARSPAQIAANIERYVVACDGDDIVGTGMLKIYSPELAEICALAIAPTHQKHGLGRRIVDALIEQAASLGIPRVIALTLQDGFFHRLGFTTTALSALPEKVAADCVACPKRHACDEIAVVRQVAPAFSDGGRL